MVIRLNKSFEEVVEAGSLPEINEGPYNVWLRVFGEDTVWIVELRRWSRRENLIIVSPFDLVEMKVGVNYKIHTFTLETKEVSTSLSPKHRLIQGVLGAETFTFKHFAV